MPSPNPYTANFLYGVAAVSASDVWAVGAGPLIEHWDGTSWQVAPSPGISWSALNAVTALSATNLWAVGYAQAETQTLIEHWDGTQWSIVPSPSVGAYYNDLTGVAAVSSKDIWAVGYDKLSLSSPEHTLVEHWDGMQWRIVKSPNPGATYDALWGVSAVSSSDVWAVGTDTTRSYSPNLPLIEHWDGTKWRVVHSAGGKYSYLRAVSAVDANDVWAIGQIGQTATERWDSQRWHPVPAPTPGVVLDVAAASTSNAWMVGDLYSNQQGSFITVTEHWDGTQWSIVPSPNMQDAAGKTSLDNFLTGVAMAPATHTAWAVGYYGPHDGYTDNTLIEYYC